MFHLAIITSSGQVYHSHFSGSLEFGRGPKPLKPGSARVAIQDEHVSWDHVCIEARPGGQLLIENLSRRTPIRLADNSTVEIGESRLLTSLIQSIVVGKTRITIDLEFEWDDLLRIAGTPTAGDCLTTEEMEQAIRESRLLAIGYHAFDEVHCRVINNFTHGWVVPSMEEWPKGLPSRSAVFPVPLPSGLTVKNEEGFPGVRGTHTWPELIAAFGTPHEAISMSKSERTQARLEKRAVELSYVYINEFRHRKPHCRQATEHDQWKRATETPHDWDSITLVFPTPLPENLIITSIAWHEVHKEETPALFQERNEEVQERKYQHRLKEEEKRVRRESPNARFLASAVTGNVEAAKKALADGAQLDIREPVSQEFYQSNSFWLISFYHNALTLALQHGNEEMVRFLISQGLPGVNGHYGAKALFCALYFGHDELAGLIAQQKLDTSVMETCWPAFLDGYRKAKSLPEGNVTDSCDIEAKWARLLATGRSGWWNWLKRIAFK